MSRATIPLGDCSFRTRWVTSRLADRVDPGVDHRPLPINAWTSHASAAAPFQDRQPSGRPRSQVRAFQARRTALVQVVEGRRPE